MKEHKDGFNRQNIDSITSKNGFHILPGVISSEFTTHQCDDYRDTLPISLWLIFCGGRYVAEEIDKAVSKASCIRNEIIKREQFPLDQLYRTEVLNFGPIPMNSNDNIIIIDMNINLILEYCTNSCAN